MFLLAVFSLSKCTTPHLAVIGRDTNNNSSDLHNASCPTWMHWSTHRKRCVCGAVYADSVVFCSSHSMQVGALHGYCLTHSKLNNQSFIVGSCQYNLMKYSVKNSNSFYLFLPLDPPLLDSAMCGDFKRTGQLCGDCTQGYSAPVYTYHPQCVNCTEHTSNWGKYMAVSLIPQTVFFVGVLALRFRCTSPHISGFILYSQLITPPPVLRSAATLSYNFRNDPFYTDQVGIKIVNALFTFHSIWNLDFFRLNYGAILPQLPYIHTAHSGSGLHHCCLSSPTHSLHLHIGQALLQTLETARVCLETIPTVLHLVRSSVEHTDISSRCLCYIPTPLLHQVSERIVHTPVPCSDTGHRGKYSHSNLSLLRQHNRVFGQATPSLCTVSYHNSANFYFFADSPPLSLPMPLLSSLSKPL